MFDCLLAPLLQWSRPIFPNPGAMNPVGQVGIAQLPVTPSPRAAQGSWWPGVVHGVRMITPAAAASDTVELQSFGYGFHLSTVELPDWVLTGRTGRLLASAGTTSAEPPLSLSLAFLSSDSAQAAAANAAALEVAHTFMVNPEIIGLFIQDGTVLRGQQMPYQAQPDDQMDKGNWVKRDDKIMGYLVDQEQTVIRTVDRRLGQRLDPDWAGKPGSYRIVSEEDSRYRDGITPQAVFRKSKPMTMVDLGAHNYDWLLRHTLYLQMADPLIPGKRYRVEFENSSLEDVSFVYDPLSLRSEAVQVSQVGFAPNDPTKVAFLSTWMGNGGPLAYDENLTFYVLDDDTNEVMFEGPLQLSKKAGEPEDKRDRDYTGTNVYLMDFSALTRPGRYRVAVDGVGTSFPFDIQPEAWESAFYVSVRGLFHQRSGLELGPPYTDYKRPRPFHPDDGVKIYQSTVPLMDTRMGLNGEVDVFEALQETRTEELVPEAWGGWFDAGDWDRRIQHLQVSRLLLELALLYPDYFSQVNLDLPESDNTLPDVVDEALWGLDLFKRLQQPDGAIRGGIESASHPNLFEASWQESLTVMVYGPGIWSSYMYAGVAARAAYVLQDLDPKLASSYRESALKAMDWAEAARAQGQGQDYTQVANQRNLAAAELYRLTGDDQWHQLFLATTAFKDPDAETESPKNYDQRDAAFVYAQTEQSSIDPSVQANARAALLRDADRQQEAIAATAFRWNKHPHAPMGWGTSLGSLKLTELLRAYTLTGQSDYLQSAILATQFALGANPDNTVFTTGLGYRYPQDPLIVDIRATGQTPPPGITVYGPLDITWQKDYWILDLLKDVTYPDPWSWPTVESYFDAFLYVPVSEFTVMQTIGPTAYGLGYLAAEQQ